MSYAVGNAILDLWKPGGEKEEPSLTGRVTFISARMQPRQW